MGFHGFNSDALVNKPTPALFVSVMLPTLLLCLPGFKFLLLFDFDILLSEESSSSHQNPYLCNIKRITFKMETKLHFQPIPKARQSFRTAFNISLN